MRHVILLLALSCVVGQAAAESAIANANRQLTLSAGRHKIGYTEYDAYGVTSTGVLDTENGTQNAMRVAFAFQTDREEVKDLYIAGSYSSARGNTDYDGYLQNLSTGALTPYKATSHSTTTDFQFRAGKGFGLAGGQIQLTPYLSYAYHEWVRDSRTDQYGYMELYEHQSVGLGLLSQFALGRRLVASVDASVSYMIDPQMKIDGGPVYYLGKHPVYALGLGLDYAITANWRVHADYRETRFKYGESPVVAGFYEPESKTTLKTVFVGVGLAF